MHKWLPPALDYIQRWLEFQMRQSHQPGCVVAVAHKRRIVLERAFGCADAVAGTQLTARHRFRVASHSKSFTAAGVLRLRERGQLRLDDPVGGHVSGLHRNVAEVSIAQLLSHSAGLTRDGPDGGQWQDRRPFLNATELKGDLAAPPVIEPNSRFKYSNHGYGLLGLVIEAISGEPYGQFISREVIQPAGLMETDPNMPVRSGWALASGHSGVLPLGRRVIIPGGNCAEALAPATGFVSTAGDLALFFGQLDPAARHSVLSAASRREMIRPQWRDPYSSVERHYGLGIMSGKAEDWNWFGHFGAFQGFMSRTAALTGRDLAVSIVLNAIDGPAITWLEGILRILRMFADNGAPARHVSGWSGRWWNLWGAVDLVPMGSKVVVANPAWPNPFLDASELSVTGRDRGRVSLAGGLGHYGEQVRRTRARSDAPDTIWIGGNRFVPEKDFLKETSDRHRRSRRKGLRPVARRHDSGPGG